MAHAFDENKGKVDLDAIFRDLKTNYQNNVNTMYNACDSAGVTPTAKTPAAIATAIGAIGVRSFTIDIGFNEYGSNDINMLIDDLADNFKSITVEIPSGVTFQIGYTTVAPTYSWNTIASATNGQTITISKSWKTQYSGKRIKMRLQNVSGSESAELTLQTRAGSE